jgi:hypothetical protein
MDIETLCLRLALKLQQHPEMLVPDLYLIHVYQPTKEGCDEWIVTIDHRLKSGTVTPHSWTPKDKAAGFDVSVPLEEVEPMARSTWRAVWLYTTGSVHIPKDGVSRAVDLGTSLQNVWRA